MVDIYQATKLQGQYLLLSPTLRWIIVLVYTTQITKKLGLLVLQLNLIGSN